MDENSEVFVLLPRSPDQGVSPSRPLPAGDGVRALLLPTGRDATAQACATMMAHRWMLTSKETEILVDILLGESNDAIARRADIAACTVKTHVRAILQKTGQTSRMGIVALLLDNVRTAIPAGAD